MARILILIFVLGAHLANGQSPWPRSRAGAYVQLAYHFIPQYNQLFGINNSVYPLPSKVSEGVAQLYAEYGITRKATVFTALPLRMQSLQTATEQKISSATLGNATLGLRHALVSGKIQLSGTLKVDFPTPAFDADFRNGFDAFTVTPMLSAGMGLNKLYWFAYGGYAYRNNDYSDYVHLGGELGAKLGKCWLIGFSELIAPAEQKAILLPPDQYESGLFLNNQGWLSVGGKLIWQPSRFWGLNASFAGALWGKYVPRSPGIGFGAFFVWQ